MTVVSFHGGPLDGEYRQVGPLRFGDPLPSEYIVRVFDPQPVGDPPRPTLGYRTIRYRLQYWRQMSGAVEPRYVYEEEG